MLYFCWGFRDIKYDIPICQSHSTRPHPIQLVPTMQNKLFTLSFQPKFLKIWFTKVTATSSKSYVAVNFFFSWKGGPRGMFWATDPHLEHPFFVTFPTERAWKMVKEWREDEKFADIRYIFSFESYGRLKLKFHITVAASPSILTIMCILRGKQG